jgi:DNA helicase-2/ATP-dependent DNA helicase PcrA
MYRTNAMSRLLEEAFLQARLPYKLVGAQRFYGRREVKDMIAFLRLAHNPADEAASTASSTSRRAASVRRLSPHCTWSRVKTNQCPAVCSTSLAAQSHLFINPSQVAPPSARRFWRHARQLARACAKTPPSPNSSTASSSDINYKEHIVEDDSEESADRWENVQELKRLAIEYSTRTIDEFLENIALIADQDTITDANAPTLLTLHAAKGLEFGAVFIVGLDDGIIPHSRSFDEPEQMEEERRLFYVGITRAKDKLYLCAPFNAADAAWQKKPSPRASWMTCPRLTRRKNPHGTLPCAAQAPPTSKWSLPSPPQSAPVTQALYKALGLASSIPCGAKASSSTPHARRRRDH